MTNSRRKGKRLERFFCKRLSKFFPDIARNLREQSRNGGIDLINCDPFNFEVKGGKKWRLKIVKDALDQLAEEGKRFNHDILAVKPDYEDPYYIIPASDFEEILEAIKGEGIY